MPLILIIDEHGIYRGGLRGLIESSIQYARVLEADSLAAAFPEFRSDRFFDLVLIDQKIVGHQTLETLRAALEFSAATRFAVLSPVDAPADILESLSAGFHGFISKSQPDEEILSAIKDVLSGRIYVPRSLSDASAGRLGRTAPIVNSQQNGFRLTPRQHEVLTLVARGQSNKEIARELHISEATAKIHTAALLRALGARNRTEAAFKAANLLDSERLASYGSDVAIPMGHRDDNRVLRLPLLGHKARFLRN